MNPLGPSLEQGVRTMSGNDALDSNIITSKAGESFSYSAIFEKAKLLIEKGFSTEIALRTIYQEITGKSSFKHDGLNKGGLPLNRNKPDYANLSDSLSSKLNKFKNRLIRDKQLEEYNRRVHDEEISRGVDPEVLQDIGY